MFFRRILIGRHGDLIDLGVKILTDHPVKGTRRVAEKWGSGVLRMHSEFLSRALRSRFLQFRVGQQDYAVPLTMVREVISEEHAVAGELKKPSFPMVDFGDKLHPGMKPSGAHAIIVCSLEDMTLGLLIEEIHVIFAAAPEQWTERPTVTLTPMPGFIAGSFSIGGRAVHLINPDQILNSHEKASAMAAQKKAA